MKSLVAGCLCFLFLLIAGCGFQLQGTESVPPALKTIALASNTPYDPFVTQIRNNLIQRKIRVVDNVMDAPYTLHVDDLSLSTVQTSVAASQQTRQYNVTYSATFSITNKKAQVIVPAFTVSSSQPVTMFSNELLTNNNQLDTLTASLQRDVINQLFDHLTASGPVLTKNLSS